MTQRPQGRRLLSREWDLGCFNDDDPNDAFERGRPDAAHSAVMSVVGAGGPPDTDGTGATDVRDRGS